MKLRLVLKLSACVFLILIAVACKKKEKPKLDCTAVNEQAVRNILVFDVEPSSPYLGRNLIYFNFDQSITHYQYVDCGKDLGSITLSLKNASDKRIYLEYELTAYDKAKTTLFWKYNNSITLPPKGQMNVGEVSKSPENVTSKNTLLILETYNVSYQ